MDAEWLNRPSGDGSTASSSGVNQPPATPGNSTTPKAEETVANVPLTGMASLAVNPLAIIAAPDTTGSVTVSLHPLVILNISEHWTRLRAVKRSTDVEVLGALIGKQTGRHIEIMNSFELLFEKKESGVVVEPQFYRLKEEQYKQVFATMDLLGWYRTGDAANISDLEVHKQFSELIDSPIFLKLNPLARHTDLPVFIFESVVDVVDNVPTLQFVEIAYTLATEEAERIGIDHVARISSQDTTDSSLVGENLQAQYNAIKMLASRVRIIAQYVRAVLQGDVPFNHEIVRQINALSHRLPIFSKDDFKAQFYHQSNDVALMAYLGSITKCCNVINRFISRFNQLHDRGGMGRRVRGGVYF